MVVDIFSRPSALRGVCNGDDNNNNDNNNIKFKTSMIRSSLCDHSDAYIHVKGTITVPNTAADGAAVNNANKKVMFKNCAPVASCVTEINYIQVDNAEDIDIVMLTYNLIENSNPYSKTSESLWQYYRGESVLDNNASIIDFPVNNNKHISFIQF